MLPLASNSSIAPDASGSGPASSKQAPGKQAAARNADTPPAFPRYSYQESLTGPPPVVHYIRQPELANPLIRTLRSPVGFDTEWRPNFSKNRPENRTALIQLADANTILLIHISAMRQLPEMLTVLFQDPNMVKVGVGIRGDATKLNKERGMDFRSLVDLGALANLVDPGKWLDRHGANGPGLAVLCETYLERSLRKGRKVTMSNWELLLSPQQIEYAANDAHSSMRIYSVLEYMQIQMENQPPFSPWLFDLDSAVVIGDAEEARIRKQARNARQKDRRAEMEMERARQEAVDAEKVAQMLLEVDDQGGDDLQDMNLSD